MNDPIKTFGQRAAARMMATINQVPVPHRERALRAALEMMRPGLSTTAWLPRGTIPMKVPDALGNFSLNVRDAWLDVEDFCPPHAMTAGCESHYKGKKEAARNTLKAVAVLAALYGIYRILR
jgi:hypothetical protein